MSGLTPTYRVRVVDPHDPWPTLIDLFVALTVSTHCQGRIHMDVVT